MDEHNLEQEVVASEEVEEQASEEVETEVVVEETADVNEDKLKSAIYDVKNAIKENADKLLAKLNEKNINEETMKKYVSDFTESVNGLVNKAAVKVNELKENPKTSDFMNKAQASYESFAEKVKKGVDATSEKLNEVDVKGKINELGEKVENVDIKGKVTGLADKVKEVGQNASDRYQKFVHDPKVQKVVGKATNATIKVSNKAWTAIKNLINKEDKEKEE